MKVKRIANAIKSSIKKIVIFFPLRIHRLFNNNKDFSLLGNNCIPGLIYHQYGLRFLSPTINLNIDLYDFIAFCSNLSFYLDLNLTEHLIENQECPHGILKSSNPELPSIIISFLHYRTFSEAYLKWEERKKRINFKNLYVVMDCVHPNYEKQVDRTIIELFNKIPYKKVAFSKKPLGFDDEYVLRGDFNMKKLSWKRGFNDFNFNRFLRKKIK